MLFLKNYHRLINETNFSILFRIFPGLLAFCHWSIQEKKSYVSNNHFSLYHQVHVFNHWLIDRIKNLIFSVSFHNSAILIIKWSKVKTYCQRLIFWVGFYPRFIFEVIYLGVLVLIKMSLVFTCLFALMISAFIDSDNCHQVWLQIVCGTYTNWTYVFFFSQDLVRLWQRFQLGVTACLHQYIYLFGIKYPLILLPNTSFVGFWPVYFSFTGSVFMDLETCPWVWLQIFCGTYTNQTCVFSSPTGLYKVVARVIVLWLRLSSSIDWLDEIRGSSPILRINLFLKVLKIYVRNVRTKDRR